MSKYEKAVKAMVVPQKVYAIQEAFELLKKMPQRKFVESVDMAVVLGVDPRKSNEAIRGSIVLPKGTGRSVRIAVLTTPAHQEAATKAGADLVGLEDLAEQIKAGKMDFDILLATPDAMRFVGQLGQVLGPRGLMPNPKDGTVTTDVANAVKNAKMGQVRYRTDKAGIVHCPLGKVSFNSADLLENMKAVLAALKKAKPTTSKGVYFRKICVSTTMGPGLIVDISQLDL
jgi:large subunit ribosomal protein L1